MSSRNEKSQAFTAMFGTPFEELEENEAASKKPLSVENQVVTDEKGRRRFHGAFTGGFSAGYYNTVGTKEGWTPATFKSTRSKREGQQTSKPEDFMDSEDLGEYGIAPRQIRTTQAFTEEDRSQSRPIEKRGHAEESTSGVQAAIADRLSEVIRPVTDSVGVRLMRSMGWRPGKGVGAEQTAASRERAKGAIKSYGCDLPPGAGESSGALEYSELEAMAPGFQFAPSDVDFVKFESKSTLHGLGYKGLDVERHLTAPKGLEKELALKTIAGQKKGIRGQAFGVGAFEDDDDDLYLADDFTKYDFTLGGSGVREKAATSTGDFAPASKTQAPRQFYLAPKLPRDYTPSAPGTSTYNKPKLLSTDNTEEKPSRFQEDQQSRNSLQRANALDESHSVWSLVSSEDRERIEAIKSGQKPPPRISERERREAARAEAAAARKAADQQAKEAIKATVIVEIPDLFQHDPKKQARFKDFVNYLKRGLCPPQPPDVTEWDWDVEQTEFRKHLPSDLITTEEDVRARQKPLAGTQIASAFSSGFKSKFTKGDYAEEDESRGQVLEDEDKIKAVQMKMFGPMTREKHEWHPDRNLCKRFNLPNPYPESRAVGIPYLKKESRQGFFNLNFETVTVPSAKSEDVPRASEEYGSSGTPLTSTVIKKEVPEEPSTSGAILDTPAQPELDEDDEEEEKAPVSLFKAVFAQTSSSSSSSSESEEEKEPERIIDEPPTAPAERPDPILAILGTGAKDDSNGRQEQLGTKSAPGAFIRFSRPKPADSNASTSSTIEKANFSTSTIEKASASTITVEKAVVEIEDEQPMAAASSMDSDSKDPGHYGPVLPPETSEIALPPTSVISRHKRDKKKRHRHKAKKSHKKSSKSKSTSSSKDRRKKKHSKKKSRKRSAETSTTGDDADESSSSDLDDGRE